jgi:hypothetical protein
MRVLYFLLFSLIFFGIESHANDEIMPYILTAELEGSLDELTQLTINKLLKKGFSITGNTYISNNKKLLMVSHPLWKSESQQLLKKAKTPIEFAGALKFAQQSIVLHRDGNTVKTLITNPDYFLTLYQVRSKHRKIRLSNVLGLQKATGHKSTTLKSLKSYHNNLNFYSKKGPGLADHLVRIDNKDKLSHKQLVKTISQSLGSTKILQQIASFSSYNSQAMWLGVVPSGCNFSSEKLLKALGNEDFDTLMLPIDIFIVNNSVYMIDAFVLFHTHFSSDDDFPVSRYYNFSDIDIETQIKIALGFIHTECDPNGDDFF